MASLSWSYPRALHERMIFFTEGELAEAKEKQDRGSGYEDDSQDDDWYPIPPPPVRYQIMSLSQSDRGILGTNLAGAEICLVPKEHLPTKLTAQCLLELVANSLGASVQEMALMREVGGSNLAGDEPIDEVDTLVVKQAVGEADGTRPVVCQRAQGEYFEPSLGEGSVDINLEDLPQDGCIQAIKENRPFVTDSKGEMCWHAYSRTQVVTYRTGRDEMLKPLGYFPLQPAWKLPLTARQSGGFRCDVWSASITLPRIKELLDKHALLTNDRPIPRYQMIVDPNQFVQPTPAGPVWVPCEFDVAPDGSVALVGGERGHEYPQLAREVAAPVLAAAVPLLAKLRRPQLLLEDQRLQAVFKAQRIIVPGAAGDSADAEYLGLWHVDGHRERVVAVVLYYYHVDESLSGGDMEFCGREPMDVLGYGDCSNNYEQFDAGSLRQAFREGPETIVHNCRVPIGNGTLLVFSNYQMAHRVLRMVNSSKTEASRDFVALFVLDPAFPPLRPAKSVLAQSYLTSRALKPLAPAVGRILEYAGTKQSGRTLKAQRNLLLKEQLQPTGEFCGGSNVHATGNGCYTMVGWLHKLLEEDDEWLELLEDWNGHKWLSALNVPAKKHDRGMSEVFSLDEAEVTQRLKEFGDQLTHDSTGLDSGTSTAGK
ncbi:unnamed protein product [Effrenium voratum]|uniref:DUF4246 domain-containing protein n=1 Tax=Effrenium voratum TaxID=2562239 RepID=A0AA36J7V5_9DINO|nr:unnamed protein product [Effrenium voratum]CAJ1435235.1 unnamed protein product [Effrenium voratum]